MYKLEFIHIPKNGGTSIRNADYPEILCRNHGYTEKSGDLDTFLILRDPIQRFESSFYMRFSDLNSERDVKRWANKLKIVHPSDWIDWKIDNQNVYDPISGNLQGKPHPLRNKAPQDRNYFFMQQSLWFNNPDNVLILDQIDKDWELLAKEYGINASLPRRANVGKGHRNLQYTGEQISFLNRFYREDFTLWRSWSRKKQAYRFKING